MDSIVQRPRSYSDAPIRILQFGQGNFLRAFADDFIDQLNQNGSFCGSVAVVKTTPGPVSEAFAKQNNRYTLCVQGVENAQVVSKQRIIDCIHSVLSCHENPEEFWALAKLPSLRFVISNTTEAGIALKEGESFEGMPESFPAKLTKLLFFRYQHFFADPAKGLILLPTELIEQNGKQLKECILTQGRRWGLAEDFLSWVEEHCTFCDTLVDRIVSGRPKGEPLTPYEDLLADVCEPFASWVIAAPRFVKTELPLDKANPPAQFVEDVGIYRERKVRILNGSHTSISPLGVLCGLSTVKDCMDSPQLHSFLLRLLEEEIKPRVPVAPEEADAFAKAVLERFENPFLHHALIGICLNSLSKFRARLLATLKDHYRSKNTTPPCLAFAFAALLAFYTVEKEGEEYLGKRSDGTKYPVKDDPAALEKFSHWSKCSPEEYVLTVAKEESLWGEDLSALPGFTQKAASFLKALRQDPMAALSEVIR